MRILFNLLFALFTLHSFAQVVDSTSKIIAPDTLNTFLVTPPLQNTVFTKTAKKQVFWKNIIKINLSSLALYNSSLGYERSLARKITFVEGCRYMPEVRVTTPYSMEKIVERYGKKDQSLVNDLNSIVIGNTTITSEVRFYGGRKPGARGFYLSLYGRYINLTAAFPYEYETKDGTNIYYPV